ncbi:hypothetical protein ACHAO9_001875 [Fusarium lateritium]
MAGLNDVPFIKGLAVPSVCTLIIFLAYFSQFVFHYSTSLQPGPPSRRETIIFNSLLFILWITYYRAVTVDPGRYTFKDRVIEADGPSLPGLIALSFIAIVNFFTTVALGIMLINTVKAWIFNQTMIEGWEQDRHEALMDKGPKEWWDIMGPDGEKVRFERLEFPYDIGFFDNMAQAMGSRNILMWFFPLAGNPTIAKDGSGSGWTWEENGFNRVEGLWPPPDPDKLRRAARGWPAANRDYAEELRQANMSSSDFKAGFLKRQADDEKRKKHLMAELEEVDDFDMYDDEEYERDLDDGLGWVNSDGDRLRDYGVDEEESEAEVADDDVPLAELMRRRKVTQRDNQDD